MKLQKHFLDLDALDASTLRAIIDMAGALKKSRKTPKTLGVPQGAVLAMIAMMGSGLRRGRRA